MYIAISRIKLELLKMHLQEKPSMGFSKKTISRIKSCIRQIDSLLYNNSIDSIQIKTGQLECLQRLAKKTSN